MKCIKFNDGHIKRVSENVAHLAVTNKDATYVSKTEWKHYIYGIKETPEVVDEEPKKKVTKADKKKQKNKKR